MAAVGVTDLTGWTPIRVGVEGGQPVVDWCWTDGVAFDDPFFDQTVERCLRDPYRLLFRRQTPIDVLGEWAQASPGVPLAGLVLHMSRCGSTLVTQMLGACDGVRVMSEPGPFDTLLRFPAPVEERVQWLRWVVSALGQPVGAQQRLVVKLDASATLALSLIDAAFPDVPRVFLYRDAAEVLVSQSRQRAGHMMPGALPPSLLGLQPHELSTLSGDAYTARVLVTVVGAVVRAVEQDDRGLWASVAYEELPHAVVDRIAPHFALTLSPGDTAAMEAVARQDAKNPAMPFADDSESKRAVARSGELRDCAALVDPAVAALRSLGV